MLSFEDAPFKEVPNKAKTILRLYSILKIVFISSYNTWEMMGNDGK